VFVWHPFVRWFSYSLDHYTTYNSDKKARHNCEGLNSVIRKRMQDNKIKGSVDSALRTWTIDRRTDCIDPSAIWKLRGDNELESVLRVIRKKPMRLAALVEKVY